VYAAAVAAHAGSFEHLPVAILTPRVDWHSLSQQWEKGKERGDKISATDGCNMVPTRNARTGAGASQAVQAQTGQVLLLNALVRAARTVRLCSGRQGR